MALASLPLHTLHLDHCTSISLDGLKTFVSETKYLRNLCLVACFGGKDDDDDDGVDGVLDMEDGRLPEKERKWFEKCGVRVWEGDLPGW